MIKPNELRVGNKIQRKSNGNICTVNFGIIKDLAMNEASAKDYQPILITKEWLLRLNFQQQSFLFPGVKINYFIKKNIVYSIIDKQVELDKPNCFIAHVEFVHDIQNLYYAFYKEEL